MTGHENAAAGPSERKSVIAESLHALWSPEGQAFSLAWEDSHIVTADEGTRQRLVEVHAVAHALIQGAEDDSIELLSLMSPLMRAFTALRLLTLASETLWREPQRVWNAVLAVSQRETTRSLGASSGVDRLADHVRRNVAGDDRTTVLDCVADAAAGDPSRLGLGYFGASVYVAAVKVVSGRTEEELVEEHAALMTALAAGNAVTHRSGRIVIDE